jgi:uncharacterized membrane protein YphA (DoxX/SURF4 family)
MSSGKLATMKGTELPSQAMRSGYLQQWIAAWTAFWFTPQASTTLGLMRIATGSIAFYSLLVWSKELLTFFGPEGMLPPNYRQLYFGLPAWSHFDWIQSSSGIWLAHWVCLFIVLLFTLGVFSRVTSVLTALIMISYANRATGALFGLDQILVMLCLYLAVGNSGGAFSVDRWWKMQKARGIDSEDRSLLRWSGLVSREVSTNIALRLVQLHLCLIYFYAGLGKLQGQTWWNGQAIWFSVASHEYQTLDLTWLADHMSWVAFLTLVTVYWEVTYPALIWNRLTRPLMLLIAFLTHLGIGLAMGMMTFGMIMLVANLSFVDFSKWPVLRDRH